MIWKTSLALTALVVISGCSSLRPEPIVTVKTEYVERNIPIQPAPKPMTLGDVQWYVVTEENFDEFLEKYKSENGEPWVFYAVSVRGYESMALNLAEIKRYMQSQQGVIMYYENVIKAPIAPPPPAEVPVEK